MLPLAVSVSTTVSVEGGGGRVGGDGGGGRVGGEGDGGRIGGEGGWAGADVTCTVTLCP